jgi:hypothetical protein
MIKKIIIEVEIGASGNEGVTRFIVSDPDIFLRTDGTINV